MEEWRLSAEERRHLQRRLHQTKELSEYRRIAALLAMDDGVAAADVARWLGVSRQCVYQWQARFEDSSRSASGMVQRTRTGRPSQWNEDTIAFLRAALHQSPDELGFPAVNWTVNFLIEHLHNSLGFCPGEESLREQLHKLGYVWKRPRYVLAQDPLREKKTRTATLLPKPGATHCGAF
jgi:transposase